MNKPLPDIHEFQELGSNTCGPSCLAMIYKLKGKHITVANILGDFYQDGKGEATYSPQLARHLIKNGIETKLIISSSKIVSPAWTDLPRQELIEDLKSWLTTHSKNGWLLNNLHLLFYVQEGGAVDIYSYTVNDLKVRLDKGSTLIVCVDENWLWGHRLKRTNGKVSIDEIAGPLHGHFIVVTGHTDDQFDVLDPFPTGLDGRHGSYRVSAAQLFNASLTWDPQIIEVL